MFRKKGLFFKVFVMVCLLALVSTNVYAVPHVETGLEVAEGTVKIAENVKNSEMIVKDKEGVSYYVKAQRGNGTVKSEIVPGEIIVKYKNDSQTRAMDTISASTRKYKAKTEKVDDKLKLSKVKVSEKDMLNAMEELNNNDDVEYAEPNFVCRITATPNDPYYNRQWGLPAMNVESAWDLVSVSKRSQITVAIIDTGVDLNHEDLKASLVPGYNFVSNNNNPHDDHNHGTHCAGITAAITNNGRGIAGVSGGTKIMPIKVLAANGSGSTTAIVQGIRYAADRGVDVISMSLGGRGTSSTYQSAVDYALNKGVVVIAASGNDNSSVSTPGNCRGVITVGASDQSGRKASFSNYGPELNVVAPGVNIFSTVPRSYQNMSGTSMATPGVAGVAALILAANRNLSPADVTRILQQTATDKGSAGFDHYFGYGIVNADKAVRMAMGGNPSTPIPTVKPTPTPTSGGDNYALRRPVTVSSTYGNYAAANAVDGDANTYWATQASGSQWMYVDLGTNRTINSMKIKWSTTNYPTSYEIQTWNGSSWSSVGTVSGKGDWNNLNFSSSVTARYVRMNMLQNNSSYYTMYEWEIYGGSVVVPTPTSTVNPTPTSTIKPTPTPTSGGDTWAPYQQYTIGTVVKYQGSTYRCVQAHTSLPGWEPSNVPSLWQRI